MSRDWNALGVTQRFWRQHLGPGMRVADATAGNGHDTRLLRELVGESGEVFAMDLQQSAVEATRARLREAGVDQNDRVVQDSHAHLSRYLPPAWADGVVFNLGWLPGGDHDVFTREESTLPALDQALDILRPGGILTVCVYYGRNNGYGERDAVLSWARSLDHRQYTALIVDFANRKNDPPIPVWIVKEG